MQQRATDQEAGVTGGAGPWPPQAPPSIAAVDPLTGDIPVNIPCTFPIGYPQNDTGQHSECGANAGISTGILSFCWE